MHIDMKIEGPCRKYALSGPPPASYKPSRCGEHRAVPVFEPYAENLPLQSGYYSFVIDELGRFHVQWGNTRSHAGMIDGEPAAAAGRFRISRVGKVAEVACDSSDYRINYAAYRSRQALYVIEAFKRHPALDVSPHALFRFRIKRFDRFTVDINFQEIEDESEHLRLLELEGYEVSDEAPTDRSYTRAQVRRFKAYSPPVPPRTYPIQRDQLISTIEPDDGDPLDYEYGPACPHLTPDVPPTGIGKVNFVVDEGGRLIVGLKGHHILSGGHRVGAAGHLEFGPDGEVVEIHLNFSGHYRPKLDAAYCRYTYELLAGHPLLMLAKDCKILGRVFSDVSDRSTVIRFLAEDLTTEADDLDLLIETALF
jgi:hypothetical protein